MCTTTQTQMNTGINSTDHDQLKPEQTTTTQTQMNTGSN
jgi:hypothetical protein